MNTTKFNLYKKASTGAMQIWSIFVRDWDLIIQYGQLHGAMQEQVEHIAVGKASRTRREQIVSRMQSRINKQRDKGYKSTIEAAQEGSNINTLGFLMPMLALPLKRVRKIDFAHAVIQKKYNGHRCLITRQNGDIVAYTRSSNTIPAIVHLLDIFDNVLEEGQVIDGELYKHGVPLQTIASWIKRNQPQTKTLDYMVYDTIINKPYSSRIHYLSENIAGLSDRIHIAETAIIESMDEVDRLMWEFKDDGYEGAMIRHGLSGYESGIRSKSLVKVKSEEDGEGRVIDVIESKDGWGILICETLDGKPFKTSAPGTIENKKEILKNKDDYINRIITIKYAELTKDGIPFQPVAQEFRDDI